MQTLLVIITFTIALVYLIRKFVWVPAFESRKKSSHTLDGGKTKCGDKNCGCH